MQGIFISYRRQDSQSAAGRLADSLKEQLPEAALFPRRGNHRGWGGFRQRHQRRPGVLRVLLAVIGPRWIFDSG